MTEYKSFFKKYIEILEKYWNDWIALEVLYCCFIEDHKDFITDVPPLSQINISIIVNQSSVISFHSALFNFRALSAVA